MHIILTVFCVIALALIVWAGFRYNYDLRNDKPLEKHRNKFIDTPE